MPIKSATPRTKILHTHTTSVTTSVTLTTQKRGRIMARVPQHVNDTLQQAADLLGVTLDQFVVEAALSKALRVIERERVIRLSSDDAAFMLDLLENPPAPNARLRRAFRNYKRGNAGAQHPTSALKLRSKRPGQREP